MKAWKKLEYRVRDLLRTLGLNAERVPVSGAANIMKGDVVTPEYLVECKYTRGKRYFTIQREWLVKLVEDAREAHKLPVLVFAFASSHELYAIIPLREWLRLIEDEGEQDGKPRTTDRDSR